MSIKLRIILGFLLAIVLVSASITILAGLRMRADANGYFVASAKQQLKLMDELLQNFIETAQKSVGQIAAGRQLAEAGPAFPNFGKSTGSAVYRQAELSPEASSAIEPLRKMAFYHPEFVEIYAGYPSGNYATTLDGATVSQGYMTNQRPWYQATERATSDGLLVDAYLSLTGDMVIAVTHKMRDLKGNLAGIAGIDVSLKRLTSMIGQLSFGKSGYFLLIEGTGRILCDPKNSKNMGKVIGQDLHSHGYTNILHTSSGELDLHLEGRQMRAMVMTTSFGWKIVALESVSEINARSNSAIGHILLLVLGIALVMLVVGFLIVRSITKPMGVLLATTNRVAQGDYSVLPESRGFYGELRTLYHSLKAMVGSIAENIALAKAKTLEAEEKTRLAEEATAKAEEAARMAERAKKEGMLAAAHQLEGMVNGISAAATELSAQIEQSDRGAQESSQRLAEAATAMNEMNTTVQEVARNASQAAAVSLETRGNAEDGQKILNQAMDSINMVQKVSMELKTDMHALHEHTQNISKIMNVISDIADQTNLLALNAAIEAARAGEAGRGFAVVADEVRKLAEKTMASTSDVSNAISAIQGSAQQSVNRMEEAMKNVEQATSLAQQSGEALGRIVKNVEDTADEVRAIATASEEQSAASEEINQSISQVNEMSSQTTQTMGQAASAIADLAKQTENLSALIVEMKRS